MHLAGIIALMFSLSIIFLGLPNQILKNHSRKSVTGLSLPYWILATGAYIAWVVYGFIETDWFILLAHLPGMFLCIIIVYQFLVYRERSKKN